MENKQQKVVRFISDSRAELQLPLMEARLLDRTAETWLSRLHYVPIEHLDECFSMAMENHNSRSALIPKELLDQWHVIRNRPGFDKREPKEEKRCAYWCSEASWIIVDASGAVLHEPPKDPAIRTYVKPCPIHRQQGYKVLPNAEKGKAVARLETSHQPATGYASQPTPGWNSVAQIAKQAMPAIEERYEPTEDDVLF